MNYLHFPFRCFPIIQTSEVSQLNVRHSARALVWYSVALHLGWWDGRKAHFTFAKQKTNTSRDLWLSVRLNGRNYYAHSKRRFNSKTHFKQKLMFCYKLNLIKCNTQVSIFSLSRFTMELLILMSVWFGCWKSKKYRNKIEMKLKNAKKLIIKFQIQN